MEHSPSTNFYIGGKEIEFVDSWPHSGHILNVNRDNGADMIKFVMICAVKLIMYCVILDMFFPFGSLNLLRLFVIVCTVQFCGNQITPTWKPCVPHGVRG